MQEDHTELIEYQRKYGYMKDYITSAKEQKRRMLDENENGIDFNNKKLIVYLEEKEYEQNKVKNYRKQKEKENIIINSCFMIQGGFNVCIHGVGSKKNILEEISNVFTDIPKLVIKGYSPASQLQQIMTKLKYIVTKLTGITASGSKRSEGISGFLKEAEIQMKKLSKTIPYILIVFHNLDSKQYLEQDQIKILAKIFNLSYIRAVCSIDHVKYSLCVTPKSLERFNFSFLEYNSYNCYLSEFKVGQNTLTLNKEKEGEALKYIMRSLTKIQKEIIQILAKFIRDKLVDIGANSIGSNYVNESGKVFGLTLKELLEKLIDEMVLNSEQQLKENLLEILDHKIFISIDVQQKTYYTMNFSKFILDKIIEDRLEEDDDNNDGDGEEENLNQNEYDQYSQNISSTNNTSDESDEEKNQKKGKRKYQRKQSQNSSENSSEESQDEKIGKRKYVRKQQKQTTKSSSENESNFEDDEEFEQKKKKGKNSNRNQQKKKKSKDSIAESDQEDE